MRLGKVHSQDSNSGRPKCIGAMLAAGTPPPGYPRQINAAMVSITELKLKSSV